MLTIVPDVAVVVVAVVGMRVGVGVLVVASAGLSRTTLCCCGTVVLCSPAVAVWGGCGSRVSLCTRWRLLLAHGCFNKEWLGKERGREGGKEGEKGLYAAHITSWSLFSTLL